MFSLLLIDIFLLNCIENTGILADSTGYIPTASVRTAPIPISWSRVAQYMPGRTDASVRSRWNLLLKREIYTAVISLHSTALLYHHHVLHALLPYI